MITVEEASGIINKNLYSPKVEEVGLSEVLGRVLAEDIYADRDFPPFNRVMMDGIAIQFAAWAKGLRTFEKEGIQLAGEVQKTLDKSGNCLEVMTGAILPVNTDVVIPYEELDVDGNTVKVTSDIIKQNQNIHSQGADVNIDEKILSKGCMISTAEIGVLATVGKSFIKVLSLPKVAIISTGDELVSVEEKPLAYQIRQSNSHVLKAALKESGVEAHIHHILDDRDSLLTKLRAIVKEVDVLILSGGVSKGKKDYVPEVLNQLEFQKQFHGVIQRPGKPFWFGVRKDNKTVFALPGNPVSTYLCYQKYVKKWLFSSLGVDLKPEYAFLSEDFNFKKELTYFLQVKIYNELGKLMAQPVAGQGSGDLANLISADGFLQLPADKSLYKAGDVFPFIRYRRS
ncbi:molybdopterin molybdotransferase MoeA [Fulvivirga lutimaris]|uniref:molybdopterin molybdotransferase MoeA n=1 Tax=Fulvivirga lutimaris TaxID=1819566 RepID=UPI0012BBD7C6|nr:molybdopterin molybdotransferase MoeA [Fulvivirga lutimaris]MTI38187.1 molybdopterin molybdenumtransferase MoeA [Fulvivirga lutimaris]